MKPFYRLISDTSTQLPRKVRVNALYVVASLEIAIKDNDGTGLALRLHSYPADLLREGYWSPPNLQYQVNKNYEAPQDVAGIYRHFHGFLTVEKKKSMSENLGLLAESFGLRGAVVELVNSDYVMELKPSINQPSVTNAFCTVRFALTHLQEASEANLVDREGRHGFVLLPLDDVDVAQRVHEKVDASGTGELTRHYLGKPVISGLHEILNGQLAVHEMRERAIDVQKVATRRSELGIIAVADVAGYGRVLATKFIGLVGEPERERRIYQARVLSALETALTATGTTQVQTAGDGFVAGYPTGTDPRVVRDTFFEILRQWTATVRLIEKINDALGRANNERRLGSRIAMGHGEYEWGRINGLGSFSPAFNGNTVVRTARLEQGVNAYVVNLTEKQPVNDVPTQEIDLDSAPAPEPAVHVLAIDPEFVSAYLSEENAAFAELGWEAVGHHTLESKETVIEGARLFRWLA